MAWERSNRGSGGQPASSGSCEMTAAGGQRGELQMRMLVLPMSREAVADDGWYARTLARKSMVGWDGGGMLLDILKGAQGQSG